MTKKVEQNFTVGGRVMHLAVARAEYKIFINKEQDYVVITDAGNNVLDEINADCSQNFGYMDIEGVHP